MDTKSLIAIVCAIIAIVILVSLTIYTVITTWRKRSREYAQGQRSQRAASHSYQNMECVKNEQAAATDNTTGETSNEYAQAAPDRCPTADSNANAEVACTHSGQSAGKGVLVHVETNTDTSF
ncbi:hypothetical protein OS493_000948 [Desmophyllum pertusum]|uniref:Uncharacterized protein n=1 Tax=Desmophyllum pertusum TaxID=174260 RepID=A0A9X0D6P9_9CNID|nr:hypothetical protein OS493_000948 [Desmophyllum pertusum]